MRILRRLLFLVVCLQLPHLNTHAQAGEWTWMNGAATTAGVFGIQGVPSPLNHPPSLYEACEFTDKQGNLWLFGGDGSLYGDLWKFDVVTFEWTWMGGPATPQACGNYGIKGVPAATNWPGSHAYGAYTFVDTTGNFWLFGGWGLDVNCFAGALNDLWTLDLSTMMWTWMSGDNSIGQGPVYGTYQVFDPLNKPGARTESSSSWTDNNNNLWVFGGEPTGATHLNDMWKYDISTNQWAWMNGSSLPNATNNYGTKGVSSPANTPGARQCYSHWKDLSGNLWMFGGTDYGYYAADLWKFNVNTNEWTWVSGANTSNDAGNVGALCASDSAYYPHNRYENKAGWVDRQGNFYMYGGRDDVAGNLNDLWKYCVSSNEWSMIGGSTTPNLAAVYGSYQVSSPLNFPGGRFGAISWSDTAGNFWMFGGFGSLGDMWRYVPDSSCGICSGLPNAAFTAPNHICPGTCTGFNNLSQYASSYEWTFQGAVPSTSTDVNPLNICYSTPGNYDVMLVATNANGSDTLTLQNYITVYPYPPPQGISQNGDTLFANLGSVSYQWYYGGSLIPGATDYFYVATAGGDYNVVCTDNNGCEVEAAIFDVIAIVQPIANDQYLLLYPNPVIDQLTIQNVPYTTGRPFSISIVNVLGETVYSSGDLRPGTDGALKLDCSYLQPGIYWIEFKSGDAVSRTKFTRADRR